MTGTLDPYSVLDDWLNTKPLGDSAVQNYGREVTRWIEHIGPKVWTARGRDVKNWTARTDNDRTRAFLVSALRGYYQHAQTSDPTIVNPAPKTLRPSVEDLPGRPALTRTESTLYVSALDRYDGLMPHRARALGYLVLGRGLRAHQVVALDLTDIVREQHRTTARVTLKGGGTEFQELPPPVALAVEDYLPHRRTAASYSSAEAGPLLTSGRGRRLDPAPSVRDLLRAVASTHPQLTHLADTLTADGLAASPNPFLG
ncbi:hypothetical protein [Streptomyces sp. MJM8645]|uniref:hypothetical protein n=1 Tax=Streptomycetaceae TaxID=2062 RepID=UPI0007AFB91F|nr:hypothetical protein [Streptomyces sp. MJM8645]